MGRAVFPPCCLTWGHTLLEVMETMLTSFTRPHAALVPQPCNRLPPTRTSTRDSWTLTGKPVSVSCMVTAPFSWVLLHTRFCLCAPRVCFPVLCMFWQLNSGVKWWPPPRGFMPYPGLLHPEPLPLRQATAYQYLHRRHSSTVLAQSLWSIWVLGHTRFVWALWASLVGMEFESKHDFTPPTVFLGLFLCPWTRGIFFGVIQHSLFSGCSAASCNFGVLTGEDGHTPTPPRWQSGRTWAHWMHLC